ncbi:hypothetical protein DPSP01_000448 [Paraphaeosphaeria sporulosa]
MKTTASNRNSCGSTTNIPGAFRFQIPEIRRISASTTRQASNGTAARAQPRLRSELFAEWPSAFNAMERGQSDTNCQPATDGLSPFDVSSPARASRRRSSDFSTTLPTTEEETSKASSLSGPSGSQRTRESDEDSCSSDDSRCCERKNRNRSVVGSAAEKVIAFSAEFPRRSTEASLEEGRSGNF